MSSLTLSYFARNIPADERTVNRLLVSVFVKNNMLTRPVSAFLSQYCISEDDEDYELLQNVREHIRVEFDAEVTLETLVKLFEHVVSPADRIVTGAVYTPKRIRDVILRNCLRDKGEDALRRLRVADVSCGCGGFLMDVAFWIHHKTGKAYADVFRENIFGIDVQEYAIERTKILLSLMALSEGEDGDFEFNLLCRDTLDFRFDDWDTHYTGFDIIVGNPPYVCSRNLSEETLTKLKGYEVCSSGHPDLYIPFFQIATEMLNNSGQLGFITMNSFLRSVNGRATRNYFSRNRFSISIVDFRGFQVFESKNTYTCLFFLDKRYPAEVVNYAVDEFGTLVEDIVFSHILYSDVDDARGWALNSYEETVVIEDIGVPIKNYCPSRHGIATLSNDTYIFKPVAKDGEYYYLKNKKGRFPIEKGICRDIVNPNRLNSTECLDKLIEKVIFPYKFVGGRVVILAQDEIQNQFPKAYAYLLAQKEVLSKRDKGKQKKYPEWYAFGRTQSLVLPRYKLFFPKFANKPLKCVICDAPDLMLYNGLAFVNNEEKALRILKAVIESEFFWRYIQKNGKPYASGYFSLSGVDIKHFGIPEFSIEEENELLSLNDKSEIERWLSVRYQYQFV